jgi:hypothetical protein
MLQESMPLDRSAQFAILASRTCVKGGAMPRGDKSKYTDKEKRQAEHIEEGYVERGVPDEEAERRAWATVNKVHGGGEKPGGSGYGKPENHEPMRKGGRNSHGSKRS